MARLTSQKFKLVRQISRSQRIDFELITPENLKSVYNSVMLGVVDYKETKNC